jgi:PAS domain S-box-containing protein
MTDQDKTRQQLLEELAEMRQRLAALETQEARQELAKQRVILQAAIDCLPFNFFAIGLDGRYMLQNAVCKAQQQADVVGKRPEDVCPNEHDLAIWLENNRRAFAGEKVEDEVTLSLGGEERLYHNVIVPILASGELYGILGVNIDITERKRAQEALKRAKDELEQRVEERTRELTETNKELDIFRKFAEASGEGVGMSELDGRIAYANHTLCRLCGESSPQEVVGKNVSAYYPQEYLQRRQREMLPALLREGHWHSEQTILPRRGEPISTLQSTFLIRDENGEPFRIAVLVSDITERKRAEQAIAESERKYRYLVETTDTGYLILDDAGCVVDANEQYVRLTGYRSLAEIMGRTVGEWTAPHDAERNAREVQKCLQQGSVRQLEVDYRGPDGNVVPVEINASVIETKQGRRILALCHDITERRRAQEALRREHRTLKHLLQSSDRERQIIAYEIHDGLAQQLSGAIMQFQTFEHMKDSQPGLAANAYGAGVTMLQQGLFEARRLIAGVRPPILDESGVVAAVGHLVNEQSRLKGPEIEYRSRVSFDRLVPTLENAIYRITQEGLNNACRHGQSQKVRISLWQRGDGLRIEIRDWGVGFDPKTVPKNRFGLEGIRQRARLLGGKCSIRSTAGKGTRIAVELPVVLRDS